MALTEIKGNEIYKISGTEIVQLDKKLSDVLSDLSFIKRQVREAFDLLSNNPESMPYFVARIAMVLDNANTALIHFHNLELNKLGAGLNFEKIDNDIN